MRRIILPILVIIWLSAGLPAESVSIPLPELVRADSVTVDGDRVYITDRSTISIYSLKERKLLKTFGKAGEGPQAFKLLPGYLGLKLTMMTDKIMLTSMNKVSFFAKDGTFINEKKIKDSIQAFDTLDGKYVGYGQVQGEDKLFYLTINLYNPQFTVEKEIFRKEWYAQINKKFNPINAACGLNRRALYQTYKGKLFLEGEKDQILVFDSTGKKLLTIEPNYAKVPFTPGHKQTFFKLIEKNVRYLQMVKRMGLFPGNFPIRYFNVSDDRVYVLTYKRKNEKSEFYIFDIKGKFLKKVMVPFGDIDFLHPYPYTIKNGKLYQVLDDDEEETWSLSIVDIE
ncbi:MAG: hypothetical protein GY757_30770 [bacterium]|nr:hypothetical protein [bacterium]